MCSALLEQRRKLVAKPLFYDHFWLVFGSKIGNRHRWFCYGKYHDQKTFNQVVVGLSPTGLTKETKHIIPAGSKAARIG
jgi:hypothetical protein